MKSRIWWVCCGLALILSGMRPGARKDGPGGISRPVKALGELSGEKLWAKYCTLCHGAKGEGYAADQAPALSHQGFLASTTAAFLTKSITDGRAGTSMGAYEKLLKPSQIADIIAYMKKWRKPHQRAKGSVPQICPMPKPFGDRTPNSALRAFVIVTKGLRSRCTLGEPQGTF